MKIQFLSAALLCGMLSAQNIAKGYVFEDKNNNGIKDNNETGISNIAVSNGIQVVLTDNKGAYQLPASEENIFFVIKPSGYRTPLNGNNTPKFYYHHNPKGAPAQFKYKGIGPTGNLPEAINFPLVKSEDKKDFNIIVFGDPQPYTQKQIEYFKRGIVQEVKNSKGLQDYTFGISLGDLVGDDLSLQPHYADAVKEIGLPWYNVMGNHDMNYDATTDEQSDATFKKNFGPSNYAFNYGNVHFIILDDILYPDPRDGKGYWGGLRPDQLSFIENDLKLVDKNKLVVISFHIPMIYDEENFRNADREKLFSLLKPFKKSFLMSAHTHIQQQLTYGKEQGWNQENKLYEFNAGTTAGDWYSGTVDELGVPASTMRDGTPRGYAFIHFNDTDYKIKYKVAGKPSDYQISIFAPKVIPYPGKTSAQIVANFFMGAPNDKVEYQIDNGDWKPMHYLKDYDPKYVTEVLKWDINPQLLEGRRPSNPEFSTHLWNAEFPKKLEKGQHKINIRATDRFGQSFQATETFRVEEAKLIP
ncbi:calcineurin-like phosphoesterase C-terminal domain-containing protein [Elizabethkingia anophelis]|nr:calcineurin-like phosphoesterase C-terminal domain-containing protein [Elizabethkingia anophelis]